MNLSRAWDSVDPLGEALHVLRMSGSFYCRSELNAPWGLDLPALAGSLMFHFVASGSCWLLAGDEPPRPLTSGSLTLVPHGRGHVLTSEPGIPAAPLFSLPHEMLSPRYGVLRHGGSGTACRLICGAVRFDHPAATHLLELLPAVVCIDATTPAASPHDDWLHGTLRFMAAEARDLRPGGDTVLTRLSDILVIQAIRSWLLHDAAARSGWLAALQDRQVGRAIGLMHRQPERNWTVEALAREVAMSRSAFAARFTELVGVPAIQYLLRWRMHLAQGWLQEGDEPLARVAARAGYESEAAFSRAFKRVTGQPPGAVRRLRQEMVAAG